MRLTLRTLLAYRDNVLDGKDTHALEQRLRDSATARSISDRIDAVVTQSRLNPIPVDAREFGWDPNDVASFLDDTMSADRLPDMERTCLENSALLAEVASCHQVLARVIAVPVQVSPAFRDRIGSFFANKTDVARDPNATVSARATTVRRNDSQHGAFPRPHVTLGPSAERLPPTLETRETLQTRLPQDRRPNKELGGAGIELDDHLGNQVPEYLRGTDRHWLASTIKIFVLIVLLGLCVANAIRPWDRLQQLLDRKPRPIEIQVQVPAAMDARLSPPEARLDEARLEGARLNEARLDEGRLDGVGLDGAPDSIIVSPTPQERNE